jgi:hypothetical protein
MNPALERGPCRLPAAGCTVPASGWTHLSGRQPWMATHRYHGNATSESFPGRRAGALTEPVQLCSPSCLRWSIHCPPALKDQLDPEWAGQPGRIMSSLHAASRIGELIECSAWIQ